MNNSSSLSPELIPLVSVIMPCRNAGPYLRPAVESVLAQPECLELLVADGGSTDGSLEYLDRLSEVDHRLRIVSRDDAGPADALNKAFRAARGIFIGWLNADDIYPTGALARSVAALNSNPNWLMVYGEGEEFNEDTSLVQRYPTLPPSVGLEGFRSHCFICQPTVLFRRSMGFLLGEFELKWRTAFDFDYWLRAFAAFSHRIGYIPHLQGRTRLHSDTITYKQRADVALEAIQLEARYFGASDAKRLDDYALELQLGLAEIPDGISLSSHLKEIFQSASPSLTIDAFDYLQNKWLSTTLPPIPQPENCSWCSEISFPSNENLIPFIDRPFGVNLIGHAYEVFGVGEDIRMAFRALKAVGIPCCVIHYPASNGSATSDQSLDPFICSNTSGGPYLFNLVCMTAPMQARWLRQQGSEALRERYTITSWPWETQQWPDTFFPLLKAADELWCSSRFIATALEGPAADFNLPYFVMPMAAEIQNPDKYCSAVYRTEVRSRYSIPDGKVLFTYAFDFNSTAIRKNPIAVVEAFQRAFPLPHLSATDGFQCSTHPLSNKVALILKTFPSRRFCPERFILELRIKEDPRIVLIEDDMSRDELLSLFGACDVFLSLHRSEGFGRGLAEALQLGVDVISTGFGGNTDFCKGPLSHSVDWRSVPIPRNSYPHAEGHTWAEPDLDHAVDICREVASRRLSITNDQNSLDPSRDRQVLGSYRDYFSCINAGQRYKDRLDALWSDRTRLSSLIKSFPCD